MSKNVILIRSVKKFLSLIPTHYLCVTCERFKDGSYEKIAIAIAKRKGLFSKQYIATNEHCISFIRGRVFDFKVNYFTVDKYGASVQMRDYKTNISFKFTIGLDGKRLFAGLCDSHPIQDYLKTLEQVKKKKEV